MNFVLTCIHIYFVCYAFGPSEGRNVSVTRIQPKMPKSTCGIKAGGPIVQQLTKAIFHFPIAFFWVKSQLAFVDYYGPHCCHYRPYSDGETAKGIITELAPQFLHSMIPIKDEKRSFLLATDKSFHKADFKGQQEGITWTTSKVMDVFVNTSWNITGPHVAANNKIWTGADTDTAGELVMVDIPNSQKVIDNKYTDIDGLAWNKDSTILYTISPRDNCVYRYKFDLDTNSATDKEVVFQLDSFEDKIQGKVSCMTVDDNGDLWLGVRGPGMVIQVNIATGQISQMISIPGTFVSCITFGGNDYDQLLVGTYRDEDATDIESGPGALYAISAMGAKGFEASWIDLKQ